MRYFAILAVSLLSFSDARVTFPYSEVLQGQDLFTNYVNFNCKNFCKAYADRKSDKLMITKNGNLIVNFNTIVSDNAAAPAGFELPAGDYKLENRGEVNPQFVFYVVDSKAPNYGSPVYAPQQNQGVAVNGSSRFATILSSFDAIEFSSMSGVFPASYPRILATGFDAAGDTQCRPVYQARSQHNAEKSWPTIITPVLTIDLGFVGDHSFSANRANANDPPKSTGMTTVYTSPGYIGCTYMNVQNYQANIKQIKEAFSLTADRFDIDGVYNLIAAGEPIHLNINEKKVDLVGSSTYTEHYTKGTYAVALSWSRQTAGSSFAFQLDFANSNDAPGTTTNPPLPPTTSLIGRSLTTLPAMALVIAAFLQV